MIVLLELLTALLEYIDLILQLSFFQQEFTLSYKYLTYYAQCFQVPIMLKIMPA